jgi:PAS domain S-box-containing protein
VKKLLKGRSADPNQQFLVLINSMADAVIACDPSGKVTLYNGAALSLINTNVDPTGFPIGKLVKLETLDKKPVDLWDLIKNAKTTTRRDDLVMTSDDGDKINLYLSIAPVRIYSGQKEGGYILIMQDITAAKTLEQQREEFLSVVTHELRTPLAIAEANISTALMPGFSKIEDKAKELLNQAHHNVVFMGELIKDLTTLARAEQGALSVDVQLVKPRDLLEQLAADYKAEAAAKGLELVVKPGPDIKPILTSEYRVHEILQNFITNAIKYTEEGSITLAVEEAKSQEEGVIFSVTDTGIGIGSHDQKKLFSKFYRSDDPRIKHIGGTGLGLYITNQLAEKLGGKIWYNSRLNRGSTFYLQVPPREDMTEEQQQVVRELGDRLEHKHGG